MARGAYDPTAEILGMLAERWRDGEERSEPYTAADFHPYRLKDTSQAPRSDVLPYNPEILQQIAESGTFR